MKLTIDQTILDKNGLTPNVTQRDIFKINDQGNISNSQKSYAYDLSGMIPDNTKRDIFKVEDLGNISNSQKSYMYDLSGLVPGATQRYIFKIKDTGNIDKKLAYKYLFSKFKNGKNMLYP